ncbi:MAG: hypothetical protein HC879_08360 [Leptolyngbyaceae cyanobacterium SL_5_9]|nr:hypothetical protein [Leptolyngbyaceae cyanobacterium SL_5_9]
MSLLGDSLESKLTQKLASDRKHQHSCHYRHQHRLLSPYSYPTQKQKGYLGGSLKAIAIQVMAIALRSCL